MAQNQTAFDPRVFDPHVFQIFGGQPVGPPLYVEQSIPRKPLRRRPVKVPVLPLPVPLPVPPAEMFESSPEPRFTPAMPKHDVSELMNLPQQMGDSRNVQDVLDALAVISALEIA